MERSKLRAVADFPEPGIQITSQFPKIFSTICLGICFIVFVFYKGGKAFFTRFYSLPPQSYVQNIKEAVNGNGLVKRSKVGIKKASYRRRLILASAKPQMYSTVPLTSKKDTDCSNKAYQDIRIARVDKEENSEFLNLIKPMEPDFPKRKILYGFFHPYSYAGGGGERVLWQAVYVTLQKSSRNVALIYTFTESNDQSVSSILTSVHKTFGLDFFTEDKKGRVVFMQLPNKYRWIIDGNSFKFLTMAFQALGSVIAFFFAMNECAPDIFIDTLGLPFSYPLASCFLQIPVYAYVHYPWVSNDMLNKLAIKMKKNPVYILKYAYWYLLMKLYSICGSFLTESSCNSSWTLKNLLKVWTWADEDSKPAIIYPPTGIDESKIRLNADSSRSHIFLYIAQFRPEKRHELLIKEFHKYVTRCDKLCAKPFKLVLIGSTRSDDDKKTVEHLKSLINDFSFPEGMIEIKVNAAREEVDEYLNKSEFGLNAMWNEHFGISVVEYMIYGVIPIVHASGGPLADIVVPVDSDTGKLLVEKGESYSRDTIGETYMPGLFFQDPSDPDSSTRKTEFESLSDVLWRASELTDAQRLQYRKNAISVAEKKFGISVFEQEWDRVTTSLADYEIYERNKRGKVERLY
ncbi:hypothetical protein BRETT_000677 [Brettanomyces bruxellensis]|uniref:GDP-Man:Man(3)GlcNAc(2)-PP-Dol alpha-1,2-mannosyltransferase n=1 Tax=Dekkera bruxellensis TaxID=5007 RepID=A0A871RD46_DEKBR|nr:uncharacterized protein BRETT_000677 [Brettanomyces bruxellensis]QOU20962.1 hypothetical protein BRETT_000677 [Brettanomyces bruxellensis]